MVSIVEERLKHFEVLNRVTRELAGASSLALLTLEKRPPPAPTTGEPPPANSAPSFPLKRLLQQLDAAVQYMLTNSGFSESGGYLAKLRTVQSRCLALLRDHVTLQVRELTEQLQREARQAAGAAAGGQGVPPLVRRRSSLSASDDPMAPREGGRLVVGGGERSVPALV